MRGSKLGYFVVGLCAVVMACSSDDSGSSGTGGSAGTGGGTAGSGGSTAGSGGGTCDPVNGSNDCPAYVDCAEAKCMAEYKQCLGDSFMSGTFGGPCKTYMECVSGCNCDATCQQGCTLDQACQDCFTGPLTSCLTSNCSAELQQCAGTGGSGTGGGGGGATCADLAACCASLSGADQTTCQQQYDAVKAGGDAACGAVIGAYTSSGKC